MARMPVEILDLRREPTGVLVSTVALANSAQSEYQFSVLDYANSYELLFSVHDDTDIGAFESRLSERKSHWRGFHPFVFCLFDTAISSSGSRNLFSVDRADDGFAAVTVHNVDNLLIPSERIAAYIAFQLAFFSLKFSGCNIPFHEEDRGCLFDYRRDKRGIVDVIRKGQICDGCRNMLQDKQERVSPTQLTSIFSLLQLASTLLQSPQELSVKMKARPRIFIASSTEGLEVARAIQGELEYDSEVEIWNQSDVFVLGSVSLEALEAAVENYDFAIFVFTPDDQITMRDQTKPIARDNVIFESGLFIGKLGRHRSFIVRPRNVIMQFPTDLNGLTVADYDSSKANLSAALGAACTRIRAAINNVVEERR